MGYFKRKIDRGRCREEIRVRHERALEAEGWRPWEGKPWVEVGRRWFLRFSIAEKHLGSGRRRGVFSAAYRLRDEGELPSETLDELYETLEWFGDYLPAPDLDDYGDDGDAIFFFKSDHGTCTRRIWDLVWILREHGRHVELQRVANPGRLVYEDEFQVAAVPWTEATYLQPRASPRSVPHE